MKVQLLTLRDDFPGLAKIEKPWPATKVTLVAGQVLVLPAAVMVAERSLGGRLSYGFRLPFWISADAPGFISAYKHMEATYPAHPHKRQMAAMFKAYSEVMAAAP